ncbi:MAG: hypothetical protein GX601_02935 [Anaerolineales bacterium]|nr:hypothetical protein [Anaerolineales bacterium]
MTIVLRWLVGNSWILYVLCAIGALIYLGRALAAQRERRLAVFSLERETAGSRLVQSLIVMVVFAALGALIYIGVTVLVPEVAPFASEPLPEPTASSGLETPTPTPTSVALVPTGGPAEGQPEAASTPDPLSSQTAEPQPTEPLGDETPTETPVEEETITETPAETATPEPTPPPDVAIGGSLNARFGDFAALVAYSLPSGQVSVSQPVSLILYWQALEGTSPTNYIVFTHLIAEDGHLVAQHDSQPANGGRPTTGWSAGEQIADLHPMTFRDAGYRGPATMRVGMYDASGARLLTDTGLSYVDLPVTVEVVP